MKKKKLFKYQVSKNYKTTKRQDLFFLFRKILFNFFGIILRPIFKFNNNEIGSKIIILGRGVSSNYFFFNHKKFSKYYIFNELKNLNDLFKIITKLWKWIYFNFLVIFCKSKYKLYISIVSNHI